MKRKLKYLAGAFTLTLVIWGFIQLTPYNNDNSDPVVFTLVEEPSFTLTQLDNAWIMFPNSQDSMVRVIDSYSLNDSIFQIFAFSMEPDTLYRPAIYLGRRPAVIPIPKTWEGFMTWLRDHYIIEPPFMDTIK